MPKNPVTSASPERKSRVDTYEPNFVGIDHFSVEHVGRIVDRVKIPFDDKRRSELAQRLDQVPRWILYDAADKPTPKEVETRFKQIEATAEKLRRLIKPEEFGRIPDTLHLAIGFASRHAPQPIFDQFNQIPGILDELSCLSKLAAKNASERKPMVLFAPQSDAKHRHAGNRHLRELVERLAAIFREFWREPTETPNGPFARFVHAVLQEMRLLFQDPEHLPTEAQKALAARPDQINNAIRASAQSWKDNSSASPEC